MECRLQVTICSGLDPVSRSVNDLEVHVMAIEEQVASRKEDEQEDNSPLDSGWQRNSLAEPHQAMGGESGANPPQGRPTLAKNSMGARSAHFEQMDVDPPENDDRQEPITADDSHNARVKDKDKSVNDSWRMRVEALFTSLDKAKHFICVQPMKWQEILMSFLWMAHLYKPSDGYKISCGLHLYTSGEVISELEGLLV